MNQLDQINKLELYVSAKLIVPLGTPLPSDLSNVTLAKGVLLERLSALLSEGNVIIPISGIELNELARAWRLLDHKQGAQVLLGLPGAHYDVVFSAAYQQIGIRELIWPEVQQDFVKAQQAHQALADSKPWQEETLSEDAKTVLGRPIFSNYDQSNQVTLPIPVESERDGDE